jgi:hypothetical protein
MKLLFIGNSHTYFNDMPVMVLKLLEATGQKAHVTMITAGGKDLLFHAKRPDVLFNMRYGGYDAVIVQEKASNFSPVDFEQGALALKNLADELGLPIFFYMPWALRDHREQQRPMTDTYHTFCRANRCHFAPAGEVFSRLLMTESPDLLYIEDGNHATAVGSYAAAVTVFYTITGRKRIIQPETIKDPGLEAGYPLELCSKIHTEACRTTRLYNG